VLEKGNVLKGGLRRIDSEASAASLDWVSYLSSAC
jgi:hypothetical protein